MKRFFLLTMGVVVIVAGGLFALTLVDINRYKPEIETAARDLTGRTLELRGLVHIGFSLTPTIVVEDVHFGNAEWGSEKNMFHADRVAVKVVASAVSPFSPMPWNPLSGPFIWTATFIPVGLRCYAGLNSAWQTWIFRTPRKIRKPGCRSTCSPGNFRCRAMK